MDRRFTGGILSGFPYHPAAGHTNIGGRFIEGRFIEGRFI